MSVSFCVLAKYPNYVSKWCVRALATSRVKMVSFTCLVLCLSAFLLWSVSVEHSLLQVPWISHFHTHRRLTVFFFLCVWQWLQSAHCTASCTHFWKENFLKSLFGALIRFFLSASFRQQGSPEMWTLVRPACFRFLLPNWFRNIFVVMPNEQQNFRSSLSTNTKSTN